MYIPLYPNWIPHILQYIRLYGIFPSHIQFLYQLIIYTQRNIPMISPFLSPFFIPFNPHEFPHSSHEIPLNQHVRSLNPIKSQPVSGVSPTCRRLRVSCILDISSTRSLTFLGDGMGDGMGDGIGTDVSEFF